MSRLESGLVLPKKDWCDMNELISNAAARLEEHLKTHLFYVDSHENMPLFKLDYIFIEQVIYNLILNACEYTPANSTIKVAVSHTLNNLIIAVEDNGLGIPNIEKENVFNKFYRLENSNNTGTGLGLSLVKGFIEAHKGTIALQDVVTGGARFLITIPIVEILPKNFQNE
jgi:two-component system sensor histidine kinase KdpD